MTAQMLDSLFKFAKGRLVRRRFEQVFLWWFSDELVAILLCELRAKVSNRGSQIY